MTQLDKALARVWKRGRLHCSTSPKKLHQLRITLRKARYLAEFFAPVLETRFQQRQTLRSKLHRVERVLGRIHDVDMAMEHLTAYEGAAPPSRPCGASATNSARRPQESCRRSGVVSEDPMLWAKRGRPTGMGHPAHTAPRRPDQPLTPTADGDNCVALRG